MNKPNYIQTKLQEFKEHFVNPDPTSSADQFKPELRGKLYSEFETFLTQALEEQAAGFEKELIEKYGEFREVQGKKQGCFCSDPDCTYWKVEEKQEDCKYRTCPCHDFGEYIHTKHCAACTPHQDEENAWASPRNRNR